ncbi:MAG TPA: dienelactone hydrolase family protein [Candidatus Sulfopaludibacter sp.]|jgi:putative phosphoribosyl transferase|nr:dienelactone hydrolase family protein [Candidatus Sulfopaludibacter sp.]
MVNNFKSTEISVKIPVDKDSKTNIEGSLMIPENSKGLVIFAHGSGSGRYSPRNQYVSQVLNNDGLSTLLIDLLTEEEEKIDVLTKEYRFDIELLAYRLISVTDWLTKQDNTKNMILGYFGASTGAAAALIAADKKPENISAIVSRGGRVDLSYNYTSLKSINCPTLFIVGEKDNQVIEWNQQVLDRHLMNVIKKKMIVISGAGHLFEEPGKMEEIAKKASGWFRCYFQIKEHETASRKEK